MLIRAVQISEKKWIAVSILSVPLDSLNIDAYAKEGTTVIVTEDMDALIHILGDEVEIEEA